jgi:hypothetical protein
MRKIPAVLLVSLLILVWNTAPRAQTAAPAPIFAQKLTDEVAAAHPELNSLGLHVTPPDAPDNVIIASTNKAKVGQKSDDLDLEIIRTGKPSAGNRDKRKITDVKLPLADNQGEIIGMVVMEVKYDYTKDPSAALERAKTINGELRKRIPSKAKLFEPIS